MAEGGSAGLPMQQLCRQSPEYKVCLWFGLRHEASCPQSTLNPCWLSSARAQCAWHALTTPFAAMTAFCLLTGAQHWSLPSPILGALIRSDQMFLITLSHVQSCNFVYFQRSWPWHVKLMTVTACLPVECAACFGSCCLAPVSEVRSWFSNVSEGIPVFLLKNFGINLLNSTLVLCRSGFI